MKRILFFALLLSFSKTIYSQEIKTDSLLTEKQNAEWIAEFEKLDSKSKQIAEIKKKIFSDTIYKRQQNSCRIVIKNQETVQEAMEKANCECKIVFVLGFKKSVYLLDPNEYQKTNKILELTTNNDINKITVLKGITASVLYGTNGRCGVVVMYSDSRKFKRKIKNVL
ncbi:hypothetical protein [Aquimarina sp. LLG6339-5]|uniref:hypothetical protein n=1 Tax=Aquimarina sp. LLG6339-5 TaxID=3160830 RepID=UPI00386E598E